MAAPEAPDEKRLVAVPARPGNGDELILEARRQPQGVVLPVFSSVRVLVAALGQSQPWAVLPLGRVGELASAAGVDQIALDPEVTGDAWRWNQFEADGLVWQR